MPVSWQSVTSPQTEYTRGQSMYNPDPGIQHTHCIALKKSNRKNLVYKKVQEVMPPEVREADRDRTPVVQELPIC